MAPPKPVKPGGPVIIKPNNPNNNKTQERLDQQRLKDKLTSMGQQSNVTGDYARKLAGTINVEDGFDSKEAEAVKFIQSQAESQDPTVKVDGKIGNQTRALLRPDDPSQV